MIIMIFIFTPLGTLPQDPDFVTATLLLKAFNIFATPFPSFLVGWFFEQLLLYRAWYLTQKGTSR